MVNFLNSLAGWLEGLVGMSVTAAWAAAVIALLWLVVFARLLVPVSFHSPVSAVPPVVAESNCPTAPGPPPRPPFPSRERPSPPCPLFRRRSRRPAPPPAR